MNEYLIRSLCLIFDQADSELPNTEAEELYLDANQEMATLWIESEPDRQDLWTVTSDLGVIFHYVRNIEHFDRCYQFSKVFHGNMP